MAVVLVAVVACSGGEAPRPGSPTATAAVKPTTPTATPPKEAAPEVAAPAEDCVAPVPAEGLTGFVRAWELVGTSRARVVLGGVGEVVFVAAGGRLYDAVPGEALAVSTGRAAGLPRKPVVAAFGSWPADAWLVTLKGNLAAGGGGQEFDLWRWQADRWRQLNKKALAGDGLPEVYRWTEGPVLALECGNRPRLSFEAFGAGGPLPPRLTRVSSSSFCPERFFALPAGDVFAIDDLSRANRLMIHWCPTCGDPAMEEILPLRLCGAAPTVSMGSIKVPAAPRDPIFALHAHAPVTAGERAFSGSFLVRRAEGAWVGEAVPGGQPVEAIAVAQDGAIWLGTNTMLRRDPGGKWERHGMPPEVSGTIAQVAIAREDEVWIVVEDASAEPSRRWSLYRTGTAQGGALDLDQGKPLAPAAR